MIENNNVKKGNIAYLLIGVLTLVLATVGATFAYFTTTDDDETTLTGNMATITFSLFVDKMSHADDITGANDNVVGLIPMSNSMVQAAVSNSSFGNQGICVDDNGNAVCQIYKITVVNNGSASMFLDGYVTLKNGSGTATDIVGKKTSGGQDVGTKNATTMRWAQVFCDETGGTISNCTTVGKTTTTATKSANGVANGITSNWTAVENTGTNTSTNATQGSGFNQTQILVDRDAVVTKATIAGSDYNVINTNYIRISDHDSSKEYTQKDDSTSALVYNEFINPKDATENPAGGSSASYTDSQVYYIVVWLSETGTNQTAANNDAARIDFFEGTVKFISAQGSEVTSTFSGYSRLESDKAEKTN